MGRSTNLMSLSLDYLVQYDIQQESIILRYTMAEVLCEVCFPVAARTSYPLDRFPQFELLYHCDISHRHRPAGKHTLDLLVNWLRHCLLWLTFEHHH